MTSDIQLLFALKVALSKTVAGWPDATQGDNAINFSLANVDLEVWNDSYIAKVPVVGGATVAVDLFSWDDLFDDADTFDKVFAIAVMWALDDADEPDAGLIIAPSAVNPLQWFFAADDSEGVRLRAGELFALCAPVGDTAGYTVDATHRSLDLINSGADDLTATIIVIGGN